MKLEIKQEMEKIQVSDQKYENLQFKSTWKTEKKLDYQAEFSTDKIFELTEKIMNLNSSIITQEHIDQVTFELTEIIVEPAKKVGLCTKIRKNIKQRQRINTNKPWFNESCETSRKKYFKSKNAI